MTTYKAGQRFKCKVMGIEATGTIHPMDHPKGTWYLSKDMDHQWYIGTGSKADLRYHSVTDLELIPDQDEPVKGDLVEVSDDGKVWYEGTHRVYSNGKTIDDKFIIENKYTKSIETWKHIRKAPTKEQTDRQEAERKAREFCKKRGHDTVPAIIEALTDYILKTEIK